MIATYGQKVVTPRGSGRVIGFLVQDAAGVRFTRNRVRGRPRKDTRVIPVVELARTGRHVGFRFDELQAAS